jgi:DNA replication protein DnaC
MHREYKKLTARVQHAKLRQPACLEDIDYGDARGLTKAQVMELATSKWVEGRQSVLLTGPTGVGKSFLACALGHKACRDGYSVVYRRAARLLDELAQARADGTPPMCSSAWRRRRCSSLMITRDTAAAHRGQ